MCFETRYLSLCYSNCWSRKVDKEAKKERLGMPTSLLRESVTEDQMDKGTYKLHIIVYCIKY